MKSNEEKPPRKYGFNKAWVRKTPMSALPLGERERRWRFGLFLKSQREKYRMPATRIAKLLGINANQYHIYENGIQQPPTRPNPWLNHLSEIYNISLDEIYYRLGFVDPELIVLIREHLWKRPDLAALLRTSLPQSPPNPPVTLPKEWRAPRRDLRERKKSAKNPEETWPAYTPKLKLRRGNRKTIRPHKPYKKREVKKKEFTEFAEPVREDNADLARNVVDFEPGED